MEAGSNRHLEVIRTAVETFGGSSHLLHTQSGLTKPEVNQDYSKVGGFSLNLLQDGRSCFKEIQRCGGA